MSKPIIYLMAFLLFIGCATFVYGTAKACIVSWPTEGPYAFPAFLASVVTSISAVLATNLGAVLGITIKDPNSDFRLSSSWNPIRFFDDPKPTHVQTLACFVYIFALLAAAVVWGHRNFIDEESKIVPLIPEFTKSLLGVIVGVIAIALNK